MSAIGKACYRDCIPFASVYPAIRGRGSRNKSFRFHWEKASARGKLVEGRLRHPELFGLFLFSLAGKSRFPRKKTSELESLASVSRRTKQFFSCLLGKRVEPFQNFNFFFFRSVFLRNIFSFFFSFFFLTKLFRFSRLRLPRFFYCPFTIHPRAYFYFYFYFLNF